MSPDTEQIVTLYEQVDGDISAEDLSEALGGKLSPESIRIALMSGSALYREKQKVNKDLFTQEDLENAAMVQRQLMFASDSDYVKLRASFRIQDHMMGRLDIKNVRNINTSVTTINIELKNATEAIKKAKGKVIDIDPRHKHLQSIES